MRGYYRFCLFKRSSLQEELLYLQLNIVVEMTICHLQAVFCIYSSTFLKIHWINDPCPKTPINSLGLDKVYEDNSYLNILSIMLGAYRAQQLQVIGPLPTFLKHPSFSDKSQLWLKDAKHPNIEAKQIKTPRYQYIKIGRTFGFQTCRYLTLFDNCLFYYDGQNDKDYKGYCVLENVYMQWFPLKNGRFLLFLSNSWDSSVFFFENDLFWREKQAGMGKFVIQLNFVESFDMLETIGKGSFSKVQRVRRKGSGKQYAAKIISKKDKNNSPTKGLVIQERKILRLIRSQYVYNFQELYEDQDFFIFIIEYLPGKDLMALWKQKRLTDPVIIITLLRQILQGLKDIHDAGIIHRDLKPQNILINLVTFKPHIIDFGLSLLLDETVTSKSYKRCGTMGYMAPQVIQNSGECKKPYSNKCDMFSYGIIAHMLLMGFNPVKGQNYDETFLKNRVCEISINKAQANSRFGDNCYLFLTKLLSKYPQFRFDSDQALKCEFFSKKPVGHQKQDSSSTFEEMGKIMYQGTNFVK